MPWKETSPMRERSEFIVEHRSGLYSFSALCEKYQISRKTGYKIVDRFGIEGLEGLRDRSRAPRNSPHQLNSAVVDLLVAARQKHPRWGAQTILDYLERRHTFDRWPARSTVAALFKRHGLVKSHRRRPRPGHPGKPQSPMSAPNSVWTIDFKGQFRTQDGIYCHPLTVVDGFSRYLLVCKGLLSTNHDGVHNALQRAFREYGLPQIIRSDNGTPFATQAIRRLSRLHAWWIRLGIWPELIEPSHPEQNGRHERMHRTLKEETTCPARANLLCQQRRFDRFRFEYNEERPHQALQGQSPAMLYARSPRPYPETLPQPEYPAHFEIRKVSRNGGIRWKHSSAVGPNNGWLFITQALNEEYVGLDEVDDGIWAIYFGPLLLGRFDERTMKIYGNLRSMKTATAQLSPMSMD
jgi:putative transposase